MRIVLILAGAMAVGVSAQEPAFVDPGVSAAAPPERAVTLVYANRPIVDLRAQVLSRMPAERAASAVRTLDDFVARGVTSPVSTRDVAGAVIIVVGGESVLAILPADVDALAGETLQGTATSAAARLRIALSEAAELRTPGRLARAVVESVAITAVLVVVLWLLRRTQSAAARRLARVESGIGRTWSGQAMRATHVTRALHRAVTLVLASGAVAVAYMWLAFVLRRFPYTRPWGESLRALLLTQVAALGGVVVDAVPGLFTVALILVAVRAVSKALKLLFGAVERGSVSLPGVYPDTAVPTRRLVTGLLWLAALAMAYPYLPGSESAGFKGISVFVGVVLSLGSTGVVQHLMSGLMLTFARAIRAGDYARVGDVEGTILQISAVATKMRTPIGEEVTIPNALVVSQKVVNYSRDNGAAGAAVATSVTIGYDTPWRQVEALLMAAAQRTTGVRQTPSPVVRCVSLDDYYVKYTLLVAPEDPCRRAELLDRLHVSILDAFNEHGVQIMSPHYVADPAAPKVVPLSQWHAPPAQPPARPRPAPAAAVSGRS